MEGLHEVHEGSEMCSTPCTDPCFMLVERGIVDEQLLHVVSTCRSLDFWEAGPLVCRTSISASMLSTMGENAAVSLYCKPFLLCCSAVMLLLTDVRRRLFDK
jgi:hypothetical protein